MENKGKLISISIDGKVFPMSEDTTPIHSEFLSSSYSVRFNRGHGETDAEFISRVEHELGIIPADKDFDSKIESVTVNVKKDEQRHAPRVITVENKWS